MTTRTIYQGEYLYPGMLFAEDVTIELDGLDWKAIVAQAPVGKDGHFPQANGYFGVRVKGLTQELFKSDSGEEKWITKSTQAIRSYIIGQKIHVDDIHDEDERGNSNAILKSNIRTNSSDGYGVLTRCGNWQIAQDWDEVIYG